MRKPRREAFVKELIDHLDADHHFLVAFTDEATFHISGKVNRHNCRIWGSKNPRVFTEHERDSSKVNVWCALTSKRIIGPFFFSDPTINSNTYLDMLESFITGDWKTCRRKFISSRTVHPNTWGLHVRDFLNVRFPDRWIGRDGPIAWPPRYPNMTPHDWK